VSYFKGDITELMTRVVLQNTNYTLHSPSKSNAFQYHFNCIIYTDWLCLWCRLLTIRVENRYERMSSSYSERQYLWYCASATFYWREKRRFNK